MLIRKRSVIGRVGLRFTLSVLLGTTACSNTAQRSSRTEPRLDGTAPGTVWTAAEDWATVSPDGRFAAFVNWNTGNLQLRELAGGLIRPITLKGGWQSDRSWAEGPLVFSPIGDHIAFPYANAHAASPYRYELRTIGIADTTQHILDKLPADAPALTPFDWNKSAGILYGVQFVDGSSELRIAQASGAPRTVQRFPPKGGTPLSAIFTPDGQMLLYVLGGEIQSISARGGASKPTGVKADELIGWTRAGRALAFYSVRDQSVGIWSAQLRRDGSFSKPTLLQPTAVAVRAAGRSADRLYYLEPVRSPQLMLAEVDLKTGHTILPPRPVTSSAEGIAGNPTWSPDGRKLAYTLKTPHRNDYRVMVTENFAAHQEITRVKVELVTGLAWSSDGRSLVIGARTGHRETSWVGRIDAVTGQVEALAMHPALGVAAGPDNAVAYIRAALADDSTVQIIWWENHTQPARVLATYSILQAPRSISVAPTGDTVAVVRSRDNQSVIELVAVHSGRTRVVRAFQRPTVLEVNNGGVPWTADGKHVVVLTHSTGKNRFAVVNAESGAEVFLDVEVPTRGRVQPTLNSNSRSLVFVDRTSREDLRAISR